MPAEPENTIAVADEAGSNRKGDVPEALRRRYFVDERGGPGLGFYVDARAETPAFRDQGRRLAASRPDPNAIRDMVAIAQHRGWKAVVVEGEADFRREAWLAAQTLGIEVKGYRPTERDRQDLERRLAASDRRAARERADLPDADRAPRGPSAAVNANLRIVESVVRSRVTEPAAQARVLATARERLARWLEQGARVQAVPVAPAAQPDLVVRRERQRAR